MSNVRAALSISAAIIVLAGCVLIAAGAISSTSYEEYLLLFGGVIGIIGLLAWYRAFRRASEKSAEQDDQRVIEEAIEKHRADQKKGT